MCREAALAALEEDLTSLCVCRRHFEAALALVPQSPGPSWQMQAVYERFRAEGQ